MERKLVVKFERTMRVTNLGAMARGTGARYLEVIEGESGEYIAKAWRRKLPAKFDMVLDLA